MGVQIEASIKHLLVFCAAGFLLFHFIQGLQKVQSSQVGISVRSKPKEAFKHPLYTFCPRCTDGQKIGEGNSLNKNMTVQQALKGGNCLDQNQDMTRKKEWSRMYRVHREAYKFGDIMFEPCFTYESKQNQNQSTDASLSFEFEMENVLEVTVIIHERQGAAYTLFNIHGNAKPIFGVQKKKVDVCGGVDEDEQKDKYRAFHRDITIEIEEKIINKLTETTQCTEDSKLVLDGCLEKYVEDQIKCKLPWGTPPTGNSYPVCTNQKDFANLVNWMQNSDALTPTGMKDYLRYIGCEIPCSYSTYEHRIITDDTETLPTNQNPKLFIRFDLKNQDVRVEREFIIYDMDTLLSSLGGYLGLLLGYSFLTFYDLLVDFIKTRIADSKGDKDGSGEKNAAHGVDASPSKRSIRSSRRSSLGSNYTEIISKIDIKVTEAEDETKEEEGPVSWTAIEKTE